MFGAKSYFDICWKIYSQNEFELSRVKLQNKVPEGKETSLRVSGVSSYRGSSLHFPNSFLVSTFFEVISNIPILLTIKEKKHLKYGKLFRFLLKICNLCFNISFSLIKVVFH